MDEKRPKAQKQATTSVAQLFDEEPLTQARMLVRHRGELPVGTPFQESPTAERSNAPVTFTAVATVSDLLHQHSVLVKHQSYDPKSAKFRLVNLLNELFVAGRVPRAARNVDRIDQRYLGRALGVHETAIRVHAVILIDYEGLLPFIEPLEGARHISSKAVIPTDGSFPENPAARQLAEMYPSLYRFQFYQPKSSAGQLVDYLNTRLLSGTLVRGRNGRIHRKEIAENLGFTASALNFYLEIIRSYEDAVGFEEGDVYSKLPQMRAWLDQNLAQGTLDVRDEKISRKQLLDHFGVSDITNLLTRYPKLSDLIAEYDEKVGDWKYVPLAIASELEVLRGLLVSPPIDKDGVTISRKALAQTMGVPVERLRRRPHSDYVKAAEAAWRESVAQSRFVAICFDKPYDLSALIADGWPEKVIEHAAKSFGRKARAGRFATAENHYGIVIDLLRFVATSRSPSCRALIQGTTDGAVLSTLAHAWKLATLEFRDAIGARYPNKVTANSKIASCNAIIRVFGNDGVLPILERPLQRFREDSRTHLRSVVEAQVNANGAVAGPSVDDYLRYAMAMLRQAGTHVETSVSTEEEGDFTRTLRLELERESPSAAENPASVILRVLERRLELIGDAAWKAFQDGRRTWERGQELLSRADITDDEWSVVVSSKIGGQAHRNAVRARCFPKDDLDRGIANLLSVVSRHYAFTYPPSRPDGRPEGQLFAKLASLYGGSPFLQSYLSPSTSCVSAALTLYMLASASNVSVGRELYHDCIMPSEEPHESKITGYKPRAGGKPIFSTLGNRSHAFQAMKWLQIATSPFRDTFDDDSRPFLFLVHSRRGGLKLLPEQTHRKEFQALAASIPELEGLNLSPNMLRVSLLLKAALQRDGSTRFSVAMGQHSTGVNQGYVNKAPYRFLHDLKIRHFTNHMETLIIQRVEQVQAFLGVSAEKFEERLEKVAKTGLGTLCADRHGRPGNDGELCKSITCWNNCPQLIVIARASDMAILQIWQHSLRTVEGDWIRDRPERWADVWLPWLEFVNVIEEKMRQSFANVWRDATQLAEKIMAKPGFALMRPF